MMTELWDSDSELEDFKKKGNSCSRRFAVELTATLDTLFHRGMRGTGEHYSSLIFRAVEETQLTSEQVKV